MTVISLSTDVMPPSERAESWRDFISRTIHNVSVERISARTFPPGSAPGNTTASAAHRSGPRRTMSVASVRRWAMPAPPAISSVGRWKARRRSPTTNSAGSWFVRGCHHHRQPPPDESLLSWKRAQNRRQPAGGRGRKVTARLAARPQHALAPAEPFATILQSYLVELSTGNHALKLGDGDLLVENICNLLRVIAHRQDVYMTPRELQRAAIARFVSRHASNPDLSLDDAAAHPGCPAA